MKHRNLAAAAILAVLLTATSGTAFAAADSPADPPPKPADASVPAQQTRPMQVPVTFDRGVSLPDAIKVADSSDLDIVGFRYENPSVVGEYFPQGRNPADFEKSFIEKFGAAPQVVGLVASVERTEQEAREGNKLVYSVKVDEGVKTYEAPEIYEGSAWHEIADRPAQVVAAEAASARTMSPNSLSWEPQFLEVTTANIAGNRGGSTNATYGTPDSIRHLLTSTGVLSSRSCSTTASLV